MRRKPDLYLERCFDANYLSNSTMVVLFGLSMVRKVQQAGRPSIGNA